MSGVRSRVFRGRKAYRLRSFRRPSRRYLDRHPGPRERHGPGPRGDGHAGLARLPRPAVVVARWNSDRLLPEPSDRGRRAHHRRSTLRGPDGRLRRRELPQPAGRWAADPDWSPDGSVILFTSTPNRETEGWADAPSEVSNGLYTIHPDATALTTLCAPCLDSGWAPSWTPDGKHIFFWGNRTFAMMDEDGGHVAHINAPKLTWFANGLGFGYAGFLAPPPPGS